VSCCGVGISIDESANVGIVVSGQEVVQTGLLEMAIALGAKIAGFSALKFGLLYWSFI